MNKNVNKLAVNKHMELYTIHNCTRNYLSATLKICSFTVTSSLKRLKSFIKLKQLLPYTKLV